MISSYGYILVFEDDVIPTIPTNTIITYIAKLMECMTRIATTCDMLYLEYCNEFCLLTTKVTRELAKAHGPSCTAAILYNVNSLKKILNVLKAQRYRLSIDMAYKAAIEKGDLQAFIATPPLFVQDTTQFETSISSYIFRYIFGYQSCNTKAIAYMIAIVCVIVLIPILSLIFIMMHRA